MNSGYRCLTVQSFKDHEGYELVPIREEDVESIRQWRNAQINILRQQQPLTIEEQKEYFQTHVWPLFQETNPKQLLFSYLHHGICIGYGALTYINWESKRAEISFLIDPQRLKFLPASQRDFTHYLHLICRVGFEHLHLHRLYTETYMTRPEMIAVIEQCGFRKEGTLRQHTLKNGKAIDSVIHGLLDTEWSSPHHHCSVFVTSISKKIPLLQALRRAMIKAGISGELCGADSDDRCIAQYEVDHFWHSPFLATMTVESILLHCERKGIRAIIPTRNEELLFFADIKEILAEHDIFVMVSPMPTIEICLDKLLFAETLSNKHYPVIPTSTSIKYVPSKRYVVKEQYGSGSKAIALNLTEKDAIAYAKTLDYPIFQPFIEGMEWSIDLYRSREGVITGSVARQRNLIINGESHITTTAPHPALESLCHTIANELNIYGHAVIQAIEDERGAYHIVECNPRFGGASTASLAVGLDSFYWFLLECQNKDLSGHPFIRSTREVRQIRIPSDRILPWLSSSI